jgi:hypothetical protein
MQSNDTFERTPGRTARYVARCRRSRNFYICCLFAIGSVLCGGAVRSAPPDGCVSEIETVAAAALRETFSPEGKFPDFGLVSEKTPVLLRSEVRAPACALSDSGLFGGIRGGFLLRSSEQLQADADALKASRAFVVVQSVNISGNEATVRLGVDLLPPRSGTSIKLCCCESEAVMSRVGDRWQFSRWGAGICR